MSDTKKLNYIKPYVIAKFGVDDATIIANAYASASAREKMDAIIAIRDNTDIPIEAQIKFIGDVITRPKKERLAISRKIFKLLEEEKNGEETNNPQ